MSHQVRSPVSGAAGGALADRLGPIAARVALIGAVVAGAAGLLAALALPVTLILTDLLDVVHDDVLGVPPLAEVEPVVENSYIHAADGSLLAELNYEQNRVPVAFDQIPEVLRHAVIATEDADFYRHDGVNFQAIIRAALANVRAGGIAQGGSTITQQYVKNRYIGIEDAEQTLNRKITEAVWAIEVEDQMTKDEILGSYLNVAYFGNGVYGVGTAADRYFSKKVGRLTLPEAAMIAGLIRAPERHDPLTEKGRPRARQRRNVVLDQMAGQGYITRQQAEQAKARPLGLKAKPPTPVKEQFWVSWVTELLTDQQVAEMLGTNIEALRAMGSTPQERIRQVFQSGVRIHTTLNPEWQDLARRTVDEHLTYEDEPPREVAREPLGSIVSVDPQTGAIRTMAIGPRRFGSCDEGNYVGTDDTGRLLCDRSKLNPAVPGGGGSGRQPGSAFKPFVLTAALESGFPPGWTVNADSGQVIDRAACPNGGQPWRVRNAGGGGVIDMYAGTKNSVNVFFAKLIAAVGPANVTDVAGRIGIFHSTATERWSDVCSMALGTQEVFPLEMASAYATFANRGTWCRPFAIKRIARADGQPLYEHTPDCRQVLDPDIADRVVDMMAGPVESGGTAPVANLGRWPTRGKTGTTQDYRDAWFVGYVKQLATAAWVGYPNGAVRYESLAAARQACPSQHDGDPGDWGDNPLCTETRLMDDVTIAGDYHSRVFGGTIPAPMWKDYMAEVVQSFDPRGFPEPEPPPEATVPDLLRARSLAEAREIADSADFRVVTTTVEHWLPEGEFVRQRPPPGTKAPVGSAIQLEISDGSGEAPTVPDVIGMKEAKAVRTLERAGYVVEVTLSPTDDPAEDGRVVTQRPRPGAERPPGRPGGDEEDRTTVRLSVGQFVEEETGPPDDGTAEPTEDPTTAEPSPTETPGGTG